MSQIPIVQNLYNEFVLYVAMVDTEHTMDQVAAGAATASIAFERNKLPDKVLRVRKAGEQTPFPREQTVADAGIVPMTSLEIYYEDL